MVYAKVARNLHEHRVRVLAGAQDGVAPGMRFVVYEEGKDIKDPDSGESLGKFERVTAQPVPNGTGWAMFGIGVADTETLT
jgi:hypothetical protein